MLSDGYENRYVAFIDILGFKNKVVQTVNDTVEFKRVLESLEYMSNIPDNSLKLLIEAGVAEVTVFSDSIIISYSEHSDNSIKSLLLHLSFICTELLKKGIFIRGAITYGQLYHKNGVCFGPAFVKTYELESELAIYPRIIIDNNIVAYVGTSLSEFCVYDVKDKMYYLDFFPIAADFYSKTEYLQYMNNVKDTLIHNLNTQPPKISMKYRWLANHFNNSIMKDSSMKFFKVHETDKEKLMLSIPELCQNVALKKTLKKKKILAVLLLLSVATSPFVFTLIKKIKNNNNYIDLDLHK